MHKLLRATFLLLASSRLFECKKLEDSGSLGWTTQLYGDTGSAVNLAIAGAELLSELNADAGIFHANRTLWRTPTSSFHLFATNRTESCHTHPGTTFAQTLSGTGAFRVPYGSPIIQRSGDSFFIPANLPHAFGPAVSNDSELNPSKPVLVTVIWTPPYHPNYTVPAEGCKMDW